MTQQTLSERLRIGGDTQHVAAAEIEVLIEKIDLQRKTIERLKAEIGRLCGRGREE